jgi:trimeric autotransporter adhesin
VTKKIICFVVCLILLDSVAIAAIKQQKLLASDPKIFDHFGWAVSTSGDGNTIAVGAPFADHGTNADQGAVYIFRRSGSKLIQQQKLTSTDGAVFDRFAWSLSISSDGNTMVVGAPYNKISGKSEQGSAYVFVQHDGKWIPQQKLTALDGSAGDRFGYSASISGDGNSIVIGAPLVNIGSSNDQGSVYIFVRSKEQWIQQQKLNALDGSADDHFGQSISVSGSGNVVASGAHDKTIGKNTSQGSVYILSKGLVPDFTVKEWDIILTVLTGFGILYFVRKRRKEKN